MKAAVFHAPGEPLSIETVDDPAPGIGEAVIRVVHCGICGTDLHATEQHDEAGKAIVFGHEFTGEIVALGAQPPEDWRVGDRLVSLPFIGCGDCVPCRVGTPWQCAGRKVIGSADAAGGFAEYVRVHLNEAVRLPDQVSWTEGALVEPLAVSLHALRRVARGIEGRNVLVMGAGPIGLAATLWARFFGARHVVVSELDRGRAEKALDFGATGLIDAREDVADQFRAITDAAPDLILECVGVPGMIGQAIDLAPFRAEIVVIGFCMKPDTFVPALAMVKELTVQFVIAYDKQDFRFVVDMLAAGRVKPLSMITSVVGFDAFPGAFEALRTPNSQCKVLLDPWLRSGGINPA